MMILGFNVFLHESPICVNTAATTVWHQSKIQWHNAPSFVLVSIILLKAHSGHFPVVIVLFV